jgi:hypothetical protein
MLLLWEQFGNISKLNSPCVSTAKCCCCHQKCLMILIVIFFWLLPAKSILQLSGFKPIQNGIIRWFNRKLSMCLMTVNLNDAQSLGLQGRGGGGSLRFWANSLEGGSWDSVKFWGFFFSPYLGKRWCYVGVSGSMPSSCPDVKTSTRYPGFTWSYMACTIPKKEKCYEAYRKQEFSNLTINCFSEQTFRFPQIFGTILWQQWWGVTSHVGI